MSAKGYFMMTRPAGAAAAGVMAAVAYWICGGSDFVITGLLFLAVSLICGGGNAVNDCFDADVDRIHRPNRPIPRGDATVRGGSILTVVLFTAGFLCSLPILPWCPLLAAVNILMLVMYSTSFKRMPILGNVCVSYLFGSVFLFGGMAVGPESFLLTAPLFLVTFFGTLAREMIHDSEDVEKDREAEMYTLPMIVGVKTTVVCAFVCLVVAVLSSFLPAFLWGVWYAFAIACVDVFLIWSLSRLFGCTTPEDVSASRVSLLLLLGMIAVVLVFVSAAFVPRFL